MNNNINYCIKCNVSACKNHADKENYCSLDCITVGSHKTSANTDKCTDCLSFE